MHAQATTTDERAEPDRRRATSTEAAELRSILRTLNRGYERTVSSAPPQSDTSWFAFQGYQTATCGPGAGHLAWERIAPRFNQLRLRAAADRRPFEYDRVGFALGYCLGLRDYGTVSIAEADALIDAVLPPSATARPAYRTGRFWFLVALLAAAVGTATFALNTQGPEYPEVDQPGFAMAPSRTPMVLPIVEEERAGELSHDEERQLVDDTVGGTMHVAAAVAKLRGRPYAQMSRVVRRLMKRLDVTDRLLLVEALSTLPSGTGCPLLLKAVHDSRPEVIAAALVALAGRGEVALVGELPGLLRHRDTHIRKLAVEAFGVMGKPAGAWRIVGMLDHDDEGLRATTRRALTQLVGRDYGPDPKKWLPHLPSGSNG